MNITPVGYVHAGNNIAFGNAKPNKPQIDNINIKNTPNKNKKSLTILLLIAAFFAAISSIISNAKSEVNDITNNPSSDNNQKMYSEKDENLQLEQNNATDTNDTEVEDKTSNEVVEELEENSARDEIFEDELENQVENNDADIEEKSFADDGDDAQNSQNDFLQDEVELIHNNLEDEDKSTVIEYVTVPDDKNFVEENSEENNNSSEDEEILEGEIVPTRSIYDSEMLPAEPIQNYPSQQQLKHLKWLPEGERIYTFHSDKEARKEIRRIKLNNLKIRVLNMFTFNKQKREKRANELEYLYRL